MATHARSLGRALVAAFESLRRAHRRGCRGEAGFQEIVGEPLVITARFSRSGKKEILPAE